MLYLLNNPQTFARNVVRAVGVGVLGQVISADSAVVELAFGVHYGRNQIVGFGACYAVAHLQSQVQQVQQFFKESGIRLATNLFLKIALHVNLILCKQLLDSFGQVKLNAVELIVFLRIALCLNACSVGAECPFGLRAFGFGREFIIVEST